MARARRLALVSTPSRRLRAARPTITDPNTVAAVEFTIGGRVGINSDTSVTVASERSVADYNQPLTTTLQRMIFGIWTRTDKLNGGQVDIQSQPGGVMGIKG